LLQNLATNEAGIGYLIKPGTFVPESVIIGDLIINRHDHFWCTSFSYVLLPDEGTWEVVNDGLMRHHGAYQH
jgi:hypothetical protein